MSYSLDLRKKVVNYIKEGGSRKDACKIFKISLRTLGKWLKKSSNGDLSDPTPKRPWKKINPNELIQLVSQNPNYKLEDFAKIFNVTKVAICLAFKTLKITRKKRLLCTKNEMKKSVEYFWKL